MEKSNPGMLLGILFLGFHLDSSTIIVSDLNINSQIILKVATKADRVTNS